MLKNTVNLSILKKKLGDALRIQSYPTNLTEQEISFIKALLEEEKKLPLDCSINPTNAYMTVREVEKPSWQEVKQALKKVPVKCECCHKNDSEELHEVWTYIMKGNTCYKTLTGIKRLCTDCHILCHTVRYINRCKTGEIYVDNREVRTHKEGYKGADYYKKLHAEMHEVCPALTIEQWNTLHMIKNCLSNYYRQNSSKFALDINYFYDYRKEVLNHD